MLGGENPDETRTARRDDEDEVEVEDDKGKR